MTPMTSRERFARMFEHREADRVPIIDSPWGPTLSRWHREGMPEDVSFVDYFDLDHVVGIGVDNSPRYEHKVLEHPCEPLAGGHGRHGGFSEVEDCASVSYRRSPVLSIPVAMPPEEAYNRRIGGRSCPFPYWQSPCSSSR